MVSAFMQLLTAYALTFVGTPYEWGGKSHVAGGLDCSGFVSELMRSAGTLGNSEVLNSQMLYDRFAKDGTLGVYSAGTLVFYGESVTKITHVAFMVDAYRIIEAGGGTSETTTLEAADKRNAMVRIRHVHYRGDLVATVKPRYAKIGLI